MVPPPDSSEKLAAENKRLKHAVEELSILNEIATAIDGSMKVEEINKLIITKCIRRLGVEQGVIRMIDQADPDQAFKTLIRVVDESGDGLPFRLGLTLTGWILKNQKALLSNDIHTDDRFKGATDEAPQIKSVLAVPLRARNRIVGILSVFNKKNKEPFDGADQRLLTIIATQSAQVIENARLQEDEAKFKQMEEDLRVARSIQEGLIPKTTPESEQLDLYGFTEPAREVGGDYYDWVKLDSDRLGCVVADVSGKGMPASLLMAQLQAAFRAQAQSGKSPKDVVTSVNEFLGATMEASRFVTLFYAIFDPGKNELTYCSAGHNPPLVWRSDGSLEWLGEGGLILSPVSRVPYEEHTVSFKSGDLVVIYTDGVTEAENATEVQWEEPGLEKSLTRGSRDSATEVGNRIKSDLEKFVAGHEQSDDLTLTIIRYK